MKKQNHTDLLIVGGGINGVGIARDATGRGLSVRLVEKGDFASGTSSASSKLIHGGLRYLEFYEFDLVRKALIERERLLELAAHLIHPIRFVLPYQAHLRPRWMIRSGLFLYDFLGGYRTEFERSHRLCLHASASPLKAEIKHGFEYSDAYVDDARLVMHNIIDASQKGAVINNYCICEYAEPCEQGWRVQLKNTQTGEKEEVTARVLVNAAGPWAAQFLKEKTTIKNSTIIHWIKGSHVVIKRKLPDDRAYILQNEDNRIVFVIPYLKDFTLIGTTDEKYTGQLEDVSISEEETNYLVSIHNRYFNDPISQEDIVWDYAGVRPLCDDESDGDGKENPSTLTRDYTLALQQVESSYLLNIFGGKLTTYRKLSEAALEKLENIFPNMKASWTDKVPLLGSEVNKEHIYGLFEKQHPWLPKELQDRLYDTYGSLSLKILKGCHCLEDLGQMYSVNFSQKELEYLKEHEWAKKADDVLWRRTKLGLFLSEEEKKKVSDFFEKI